MKSLWCRQARRTRTWPISLKRLRQIPADFLGRRLGRRHRPHPGRTDRPRRPASIRQRSTTCRLKAAARRSPRSSADTSPPASRASANSPSRSKAGMRALAVSRPSKIEGYPTLKEQGIDVELCNWRGTFGAPGITTQQRDALIKIDPRRDRIGGVETTLEKLGWSPVFLSRRRLQEIHRRNTKRVAGIIDSLGIKRRNSRSMHERNPRKPICPWRPCPGIGVAVGTSRFRAPAVTRASDRTSLPRWSPAA